MNNKEAAKWLREAEILDLASGNTKDREAVNIAISALQEQDSPKPTAESVQNVQNENLISRKAAIGTVKNMRKVCDTEDINDYYDLLIAAFDVLPSALPLVIHCTDCEDWHERQSILGFAISELPPAQPEIIMCKDCKFYSPMNKETKTGICNLTMHQNFGDDWFCAGAERRVDA